MRQYASLCDDFFCVPVVLLVPGIHRRLVSQFGEQGLLVTRPDIDYFALPGDNPASGRLFIKLARIAVAVVEVILISAHVPLRLALAARRRPARLTARACGRRRIGIGPSTAASAGRASAPPRRARIDVDRRSIGRNPAPVLQAAVNGSS